MENNYHLNGILLINTINYQYVRAENKFEENIIDQTKNKQLIYVPENLINASLSILYKKYGLHFFYNFIDKRYTTSSNTDYLRAYQLFNVKVSRGFKFNQNLLDLQLGISNLTNEDYQVISGRPMPRRIISMTLKYRFLQK